MEAFEWMQTRSDIASTAPKAQQLYEMIQKLLLKRLNIEHNLKLTIHILLDHESPGWLDNRAIVHVRQSSPGSHPHLRFHAT